MFDAFVIEKITASLNEALRGLRIQRIRQPEEQVLEIKLTSRFFIHLDMRAASYHMRMLQNKSSDQHLQTPFSTALRRYMEGGRHHEIKQLGLDRTLCWRFYNTNNVLDVEEYRLYMEFMGRHSNLILTDAEDVVLHALKLTPYRMQSSHPVRVGEIYTPLGSEKQDPRCLQKSPQEIPFQEVLGFHKGLMRLLPETWLEKSYADIATSILQQDRAFLYRFGERYDYHLIDNDLAQEEFSNLFEAMDRFYSLKPPAPALNLQPLLQQLKRHYQRIEHKIERLQDDLYNYMESDLLRKKGDLIYANLYQLKNHETSFAAQDFETGETIEIALDPAKTPVQNARQYHRDYAKAMRGKKPLQQQIETSKERLELLAQLIYEADTAKTREDYHVLEQTMDELKLKKKKSSRPPEQGKPRKYQFRDTLFLVGRNAKQNDKLSTRSANRDHVWFHAKDIPGSHVVMQKRLQEVDEETLNFGARLAASHSAYAQSENVPVDYTELRHLKKPKGAAPGFVHYTHQKTLFVNPLAERLDAYEIK